MQPRPTATGTPPTDARERWRALRQLERWLEGPMLFLSFVWLALLLVELVWGTSRLFETLGTAIWLLFVADFGLRLALAPGKLRFLRGNWLTLVSLLVPALRLVRFLRVLRLAHAVRGMQLVKVVGSANRGMNALRRSLGRRRFGYVLSLTALVTLLGAGGMLALEPHGATAAGNGFSNYADALWWTAMLITTIGSQYWPQTAEGRILCFLLSVYGFAVFGYVTATLATFFIGRDEGDETVTVGRDVQALRREIAALRDELRRGPPTGPEATGSAAAGGPADRPSPRRRP
jgi:voltage-gated potassium channel